MDETETIPYATPKRENGIVHCETIVYASPKRESEDQIEEEIYKEPKFETAVETEKQVVEDEKKFESELEQNKVDIHIAKETGIKKVQDIFDEVKEEEPMNFENLFIDDNDIFDIEEISNTDWEFINYLINRTNFIADANRVVEESNTPKMEIVHPQEKKLRGKNKCQLMTTKRQKIRALKIV